ncbi:hypothetical protein NM688_g2074 [Phlebia brevispora]|uniref:Uncharacterized protein n=1 Tax=Phlebia brevispora TaxID=194682 RepID=A0ACC1T9P3_9APHY|nr:hypothetical protein NM688_g2074 [Phlebia brevispora]
MKASLILPLLTAAGAFGQNRTYQYVVHNDCPTTVNLIIAGKYDSVLFPGASVTKTLGPDAGFFYTDGNGGSTTGEATRAGFYLESGYYYIVKDVDHFNVGLSVSPRGQPSIEGFCAQAICTDVNCTAAFTSPPTGFPPPGPRAPIPPLYECGGTNATTFDIVFCPSGLWPGQPDEWEIHPGFDNDNKCLDVRGDVVQDGTPVQIYDCNGTPAQQWNIVRGSTKVQLAGTNFCLDAGSDPASGVGMKIWQCYANLAAQQWYYTDDNRIAVQNHGQCLDLTNGILTDGNQVQTWACTANNANQVWTLSARPQFPPPVSHIHPNGDNAKCLDVRADVLADGTPVQIYDCNGTPAQDWILLRGSTMVQLNGTDFCLDAGSAPANGVGMKIWQCYAGLAAQQWYYTDDDRIALENQGPNMALHQWQYEPDLDPLNVRYTFPDVLLFP